MSWLSRDEVCRIVGLALVGTTFRRKERRPFVVLNQSIVAANDSLVTAEQLTQPALLFIRVPREAEVGSKVLRISLVRHLSHLKRGIVVSAQHPGAKQGLRRTKHVGEIG